ncbi:MAG: hypothetical protein Q8P98_00075 [Candidatus Rokubacteria bacterium]|nr:hypothetical protein [Candidatus Rokubacteria bacterium]
MEGMTTAHILPDGGNQVNPAPKTTLLLTSDVSATGWACPHLDTLAHGLDLG